MGPPTLLVFSTLRWDFVYCRPQQLMSRLAGRWRVLFVEEPVRDDEAMAHLERRRRGPALEVLVPHLPRLERGFDDPRLPALLAGLAAELVGDRCVAWLYTPLALPLAEAMRPASIVYDCMEAPAGGSTAQRWRQLEATLLRRAALVLTCGPSLHAQQRTRHTNVHGLPSAVDAAHFAPERLDPHCAAAARARALQGALPHPRLGFFGVIDERVDLALLARLSDAHPDWQLVMVGPLVGIPSRHLPQRPNLHWLGLQPYADLPYLMASWDLALMPFVVGESTRWISPAKTLEYMAGGKPIVATAVPDVLALYGSVVEVARNPREFVQACENVLSESPKRRCARAMDMLTTVSTLSWKRTADVVHRLLLAALPAPLPAPVPALAQVAPPLAA